MIHTVGVDFSQFYLRGDDPVFDLDVGFHADTGIASADGKGSVIFVAFRQSGDVEVEVEVLESVPTPPDAAWQDVVELPLTASSVTTLSGWMAEDDDRAVPLVPGESYRLRFAVRDADRARDTWEPPFPERYLIQLWPAAPEPPQILVSASAAGQYWNFQKAAVAAHKRALQLPEGTRTLAMIDAALREHPEVAERIRRGEHQFRSGVHAYTQKVYPRELEHAEIDALIDERAADVG